MKAYVPTPEEIARESFEISSGWSQRVRSRRWQGRGPDPTCHARLPVVRHPFSRRYGRPVSDRGGDGPFSDGFPEYSDAFDGDS